MAYDIKLNLPAGWTSEQDVYEDESGFLVTHFEAHLPNDAKQRDDGLIDIYVGDMPEGETAEDQAFANYAEIVGFDEEDPEDFNPLEKIKFNNKPAWTFEAICEDDSPMKFIAQEVRKGVLAVMVIMSPDDSKLDDTVALVEKSFRV